MLLASLLALAVAAPDPVAAAVTRPAEFNPRAIELFESDTTLMRWALRDHDRNGDGWLSLFEAQDAAQAFKRLSDQDANGRVTSHEYRETIRYIRLRYAM